MIPKSTLSHHLKTLREAGVVRNLPHGRRRYLHLRGDELESRFPGLLAAVLGAAPTPAPAPAPDSRDEAGPHDAG